MRWLKKRSDDDFGAEIEAHIALEADRLIANGRPPEEARIAVRKAFGNVTAVRERFHDSSQLHWVSDALKDASYTLRSLRRNPAFAFVANCASRREKIFRSRRDREQRRRTIPICAWSAPNTSM